MDIKFIVRQVIKMAVQNLVLPFVYTISKKNKIDNQKIIFADAHHNKIPYSMEYLRTQIDDSKWNVKEYFLDYQGNSFLAVLKSMIAFMKDYANARCVFICDNFLPVSSCNKRRETCVVQLWHAGGILKKYAYDTPDDIPKYYKGHVYKNYDITTVSAKVCVPVYEQAMRLKKGTVYPIGLSRTDSFYDRDYLDECQREFYEKHPEAEGKRVVLFAPTFRGKASNPYLIGEEWIENLEQRLNETCKAGEKPYKVYMRVHPHLDNKKKLSNIDIETQRLLPVIDLLISDVSSVIFDYILLSKPLVLYLPDLEELEKTRGFYIPLTSIPGTLVTDGGKLAEAVKNACDSFYETEGRSGELSKTESMSGTEDLSKIKEKHKTVEALNAFREKYMGACDGQATERLLTQIGLK